MEIVTTIEQVKAAVGRARSAGKKTALVPTMGSLHAGHVSLIETAKKKCDFVVVSIFVNPTQFGAGEDFEKYPRNIGADAEICEKAGVDIIFAPSVEQMYPQESLAWVDVEKITDGLCGAFRPGHFRGVATVCMKLFNIVQPDIAFFGQKDAQQIVVIRKMVKDLNVPLEIVVCPTVRESDGFALSSRNKYLSERERQQALLLYKALATCRQMISDGQKDSVCLIKRMKQILAEGKDICTEYVSIVDAETLKDVLTVAGKVLLAVAARVGSTRLIDNIIVDSTETGSSITL